MGIDAYLCGDKITFVWFTEKNFMPKLFILFRVYISEIACFILELYEQRLFDLTEFFC